MYIDARWSWWVLRCCRWLYLEDRTSPDQRANRHLILGQTLSDEDLHLLHAQFDHLGYRIDQRTSKPSLNTLRSVAFVPDSARKLYLPGHIAFADQPVLLEYFLEERIPLVNGSDKRDKDESDLTQSGIRFLKAAGVMPLSRLIHHYADDIRLAGEEEALSIKLQNLTHAFQRIYVTHTGEVDTARFGSLQEVQAWQCMQLTVRYILDNDAGWKVDGSAADATALYDTKAKRLFFLRDRDGKAPLTAVARELNRVYFPERTVSPTIELLLHRHVHEWDRFLDDHNFEQAHRAEVTHLPEEGAVTTFSSFHEEEPEPSYQPDSPVGTSSLEHTEPGLRGDGVGVQSPSPVTADDDLNANTLGRLEEKSTTTDRDANGMGGGSEEAPLDTIQPEEKTTSVSRPIPSRPEEKFPPHPLKDKGEGFSEEEIPTFTGQIQPPVILLSNNYSALQQRYGFPKKDRTQRPNVQRSPVELADENWKPVTDEKTLDEKRITQVRFTLHYYPRYQGFLRLHARARKMLADQSLILRCYTDYDSEFDLYADYEKGILYNREILPAFLDSHNIPAGGIVYLELVHGNTVRLFWEKSNTVIKDVIRYEARENGSVEKFVVAINEYECEVNEAVYRAETRFEDPDAFFLHAKDKAGVLTTICDAFEEPGRVLIFMDVLNAVLKERPAAEATVRWLLHQLDCFVSEESDQWRFVPEKGLGIISSSDGGIARPGFVLPTSPEDGQQSGQDGAEKKKITGPIATLLADVASSLNAEVQRLRTLGAPTHETLEQLIGSLRDLLLCLERDVAALQVPSSVDEQLDKLWQTLQERSSDHVAQQALVTHLFEQLRASHPAINVVLQNIQSRVARTPQAQRAAFVRVLTTLADQARQDNLFDVAHTLYLYLQKQHAGNFRREIEELEQAEALNHIIEQVEQSHDLSKRWQSLAESWQQHPNASALRRVVVRALLRDSAEIAHKVENALSRSNVPDAFAAFESLRAPLRDLEDAWVESDEAIAVIGPVVRRLFVALIEEARANEQVTFYRYALMVTGLVPLKRAYVNADELLEAATEESEELERHADVAAAAVLMEYVWHCVDSRPVSPAVAYRFNERLSTLWERINQFHLALARLKDAYGAAPTAHQRNRLDSKLRDLQVVTEGIEPEEETHRLQTEFQRLTQIEAFMALVSPSAFAALRRLYQ